MEALIRILFSAPGDPYGELRARLQQRYAVRQARDDAEAVELADQARATGQPYALALIAADPPTRGEPEVFQQLRVIAPTTVLLALAPSPTIQASVPLPPDQVLVEPMPIAAVLARIADALEERAGHLAQLRSEVVAPLAALCDAVLQQPDLLSALRALYQQLAGLVPADYLAVTLYDWRRTRVLVPLLWDHGTYRSSGTRAHTANAGLADWVMAHDTPVLSGDLPADAARRGWPTEEPGNDQAPASALVLPLHLAGQVTGALSIHSGARNAFTQADYRMLSFVADFMVGVISHWWGQRRWLQEHQVLSALDRQLADATDRAAMLTETAAAALQVTGMAAATMIGLGAEETVLPPVVVPPDTTFAAFTPMLEQLARHLAAARQGGAVDYATTTRTLSELGRRGAGRIISYALSNNGQTEALLWLLHGNERPFDEHDHAGLAAVVRRGQAALNEQTRAEQRTREQQALARLAWRASVEQSLPLLLSTAFSELRRLVDWAGLALWQADAAQGVLRLARVEGTLTVVPAETLPLDYPVLAPALEQGGAQPLAPTDPALLDSGPALAISLQRSPAQAQGVLVLERAPGAPVFTPQEESQLVSLGQLLAAGIERLRWQRVAALHQALAQVIDQPAPAVWAAVVAVVAEQLGPETGAALLRNEPELRPLAVASPPDQPDAPPWASLAPLLRAGDGPRVLSGATGAPLGSLAVAPLGGAHAPGVLLIWSPRLQAYGTPELELLTQAAAQITPLLAAQTAPGQETPARLLPLFQQLQQAALAAPDVAGLLRQALRHILAGTPAAYGALFLREAGDVVQLRAEYPEAAQDPTRLQALATEVAHSGQAAQQTLADPAVTVAGLPLREGPASIGALLVVSPRAGGFTPDDRQLLAQGATLVAGVVRPQQIREAAQAVRAVAGLPVPIPRLLARLPALICRALNVPVCHIHVLDRRQNRYHLAGLAGLAGDPPADALDLATDDPGAVRFFEREQADRPGELPENTPWPPARLHALGVQFGAACPLLVEGRPFGILAIHTFDGQALDPDLPPALSGLAGELAAVLGAAQQERRLGLLQAGTALLLRLPGGVSEPPTLPDAAAPLDARLQQMVQQVADLTNAGGVYLLLRGENGRVALRTRTGAAQPGPIPPGVAALLNLTEPRYLPDLRLAAPAEPSVISPATRSTLALPVALPDESGAPAPSFGVLLLESPTPCAFSDEDLRLLRVQAALIAGLLFQYGLATQVIGQDQQMRDLLQALPSLVGAVDQFQLYQQVIQRAQEALSADLVILFPQGPGAPDVPPQRGNRGPAAGAGNAAVRGLVQQVLTRARRHPAPTFVPSVDALPAGAAAAWLRTEGIQTMIFAPLVADGMVLGALFAGWRRPVAFDAARRQAVQLVTTLIASVLGASQTQTRLAAALQGQMQSLSVAAHELREPLDKVHTIIETALNGLWQPMSDKLRERLSVADTLLAGHNELLNRVLQLDQLRMGQRRLQRTPVVVGRWVAEVAQRLDDPARQAQVTLTTTVDPLLATQRVLLDPVLLGQALGHLIQNGLKYTPAGGRVAVQCRLAQKSVPGRELVFTVEDTGIGMPDDQLEPIFAPYYQIDRSQGHRSGLGLGLPLARLIADLHGGSLTVESRPGRGSRFTLRLPFLPVPNGE